MKTNFSHFQVAVFVTSYLHNMHMFQARSWSFMHLNYTGVFLPFFANLITRCVTANEETKKLHAKILLTITRKLPFDDCYISCPQQELQHIHFKGFTAADNQKAQSGQGTICTTQHVTQPPTTTPHAQRGKTTNNALRC